MQIELCWTQNRGRNRVKSRWSWCCQNELVEQQKLVAPLATARNSGIPWVNIHSDYAHTSIWITHSNPLVDSFSFSPAETSSSKLFRWQEMEQNGEDSIKRPQFKCWRHRLVLIKLSFDYAIMFADCSWNTPANGTSGGSLTIPRPRGCCQLHFLPTQHKKTLFLEIYLLLERPSTENVTVLKVSRMRNIYISARSRRVGIPLNVTIIISRSTILGILNMKTAQIVLEMGIEECAKGSLHFWTGAKHLLKVGILSTFEMIYVNTKRGVLFEYLSIFRFYLKMYYFKFIKYIYCFLWWFLNIHGIQKMSRGSVTE